MRIKLNIKAISFSFCLVLTFVIAHLQNNVRAETHDDAVSFYKKGNAYFKEGQINKAISEYDKAIELNPEFTYAYAQRGYTYQLKKGEFDKAISDYNRAIELNPDVAFFYYFRGNAYYVQEKFDDAISDYSKAIDLYPEFAVAYQNRGSAYFSDGNYIKAISDYDRAIELKPENAVSYSSRGNAYFQEGLVENAVADYNMAIELDPEISNTDDNNKVDCRRIAPTGSKLKRKICLTKAQWIVKEKGHHIPNNKAWSYEDYLVNIMVYK